MWTVTPASRLEQGGECPERPSEEHNVCHTPGLSPVAVTVGLAPCVFTHFFITPGLSLWTELHPPQIHMLKPSPTMCLYVGLLGGDSGLNGVMSGALMMG